MRSVKSLLYSRLLMAAPVGGCTTHAMRARRTIAPGLAAGARQWAFALLCFVALAAPLHAAERPGATRYPDTPEGVVRAYCETLFRVSNRNSLEMPTLIQRYVAFDVERYPALYVVLVTAYKLDQPIKFGNDGYRVDVTYTVVALEYTHSEGEPFFATYPITETVPFIVRKTSAGWKIDYPRGLLPHVSVEERIKYHRVGGRALANILEEHLKEIGHSER